MKIKLRFLLLALFLLQPFIFTPNAFAVHCRVPPPGPSCGCCNEIVGDCQTFCTCVSNAETGTITDYRTTLGHITNEFNKHREWMTDFFFNDSASGNPAGLLAALQLMTSQLSLNAMQQVQIIGTFFDAKHQLETQRLFQVMTAKAHKDYQPSQNLCSFGSVTQSLAESSRKSDNVSSVLAKRSIDRQIMSNNNISVSGAQSDKLSRLRQYIEDFCDPTDNSGENEFLCLFSNNNTAMYNKDINFTDTVADDMTLDIDFTEGNTQTDDEESLFALYDNLLSHDLYTSVNPSKLVDEEQNPAYQSGAKDYLHARSVIAKRSVAVNSLAAVAALKSKGDDKAQPFIYALIQEMGGTTATLQEIQDLIGENPSYYAQMKILSKIYYQRPEFFSELYDKPANVARLNAAIQATNLMRKRDLYRSYLRSEMTLAVMLETSLIEEIRLLENEINRKAGNL